MLAEAKQAVLREPAPLPAPHTVRRTQQCMGPCVPAAWKGRVNQFQVCGEAAAISQQLVSTMPTVHPRQSGHTD